MGAAKRKLAYHVTVADKGGEQHTFGPNDELPGWAAKAITNPSAWEGGGAAEEDTGEEPVDYSTLKVAELEAEIDRRNADRSEDGQIVVGGDGNKADLVAALQADDAGQGA